MSELPSVAKTQIPKGAEATSSPQSGNPPKAAEKTNQSPLREASEVMARNNASALPKRLVVFHGGFLDEQSDHPRRMQEIWAANGVPKEQLLVLPNCYKDTRPSPEPTFPPEAVIAPVIPPPATPEPPKSWRGKLWNKTKQVARGTANLAGRAVKSTYNAGAKAYNWVDDKLSYGKAVHRCLEQYQDLNHLESHEVQCRVETLSRELTAKGYTPENPAEISLVAHSGGGAASIALARYASKPGVKLPFRVAEVTTLGSPLTESHLEAVPKGVELNYVTSKNDDLQQNVTTVSRGFAYLRGFFYDKESNKRYRVVDNVNPFLRPGDDAILSSSPGHRAYHLDPDVLRRIIPDSLQVGPGQPLASVRIP